MKHCIKRLLAVVMVVAMLTSYVVLPASADESQPQECQHTGGTATCTDQAVCESCGTAYGDPVGHAYGDGTVTTEATCVTEGVLTKTCDCGNTITEPIPATGTHSYGDDNKCGVCGAEKIVEPANETPVDDESNEDEGSDECTHANTTTTTVEAACTEAGSATVTCADCGETVSTTAIDATGHNVENCICTVCEVAVHTYADGSCICGEADPNYVPPETQHTHVWNEGEVTTEAICTDTGVKTFTCQTEGCGETKTETIPAQCTDENHAWECPFNLENPANRCTLTVGCELVKNHPGDCTGMDTFEGEKVAMIGTTSYTSFADAMNAANAMTGSVIVEIYGEVEFTNGMELNGSYTSISFVKGEGATSAKITINQTAGGDYLTAHNKTVSFSNLTLAKADPKWSGNSGHMGNYFSIQGGTVTYTNCTFPNGACTSGGTATYTGCTFQNSSEYGLWVYDDAHVTVSGGTIDSKKGIKVYSEDENTITSTLTVQNATFTANVTGKPAVAIGYAESITLLGNTYNNSTGVLELDSGGDADCNGITFVAKDASGNDISSTLTAVDRSNSGAACGVLMDGKIYTTATAAADAAEDAESTSKVVILYETTETATFPAGTEITTRDGVSAPNVSAPVAAAKIGDKSYATLQAAIDAVPTTEGEYTITLMSDCEENVTVTQAADVKITIDGDGKQFTGVMTVFGDGGKETAALTIKEINFVAANGASSCIVSPDRSNNNAYSYATNVTVSDCTFTDPDGSVNCAAIRTEDGGDMNWTVTGCTVDNTMHSLLQVQNIEGKLTVSNCTVNSKNGINLNSTTNVEITGCSFNVKGYAVRAGVSSGGNPDAEKNYVLNNNTLKSECDDGDAVVMLRTSAANMNLSMEQNVVSGTTHISGTTEDTTVSADKNYWDGKSAPVVSASDTAVEVTSYYTDAAKTNLVAGSKAIAKVGNNFVTTVEDLLTAIANEANPVVELYQDVTIDVAPWQQKPMGGANTKSITINGNGHTLTFNQTDSDWNHVTTANDAKLILNDMKITNAGHNDSAWNRHDINFDCPVELNNVTSDKALAFKDSAALDTVTINDPNTADTYAIWIQPNGQTVSLNNCTIDMLACTDGRGIKIDEQYVSNPSKVTLSVSNTSFKTEEKAAILVKSSAGAAITLSNVDISGVVADTVNPVWVDEATAPEDVAKVTVNGLVPPVEGSKATQSPVAQMGYVGYESLAAAVDAAEMLDKDSTIVLLRNVDGEAVNDSANEITITNLANGKGAVVLGKGDKLETKANGSAKIYGCYDNSVKYGAVEVTHQKAGKADTETFLIADDGYLEMSSAGVVTGHGAEVTTLPYVLNAVNHKATYTKGSSRTLQFESNMFFGTFANYVEVDGKELDSDYYDAEKGSTIITLSNGYLRKLSTGKHTLEIWGKDGKTAACTFYVKENDNADETNPKTGDTIMMPVAVMAVSAAALVVLLLNNRKRTSI